MTLTIPQRRKHNRQLAERLAAAGYYVFPSSGKTPLVPVWQLPYEKVDPETHNVPVNGIYGATNDPARVKQIWKQFPDAVPSISCGPSGVLVLDADSKKNGPEQINAWLKENNIDTADCPITQTQSGGLHIYFKNIAELGSSAGLFADLGTDVRGVGGQVVAPGAIREDGRQYTAAEGQPDLIGAEPPAAPEAVITAVKTAPKSRGENNPARERELIETLRREEWPGREDLIDETVGKFDIKALKDKDPRFRELLDAPDRSTSENRWRLARCLWAEYGASGFSVLDYAGLVECLNGKDYLDGALGEYVGDDTPGEAQFNHRALAREWYRGENSWGVTDGSAFGAVVDEDDADPGLPPEQQALKDRKKAEKAPFELLFADELAAAWKPTEWLVKHLVPARGVGLLVGDSNVGKSFLMLGLADAMERGVRWLDHKTKTGGVLYVPGEGVLGIDSRCAALRLHNGALGRFSVVRHPVIDLFGQGNITVRRIVEAAHLKTKLTGVKTKLVVLDTLASVAPGMEENAAKDIGIVLSHARAIEAALECCVLIVHHLGKNKDNGIRGSSALRGNTDFVLMADEVRKDEKKPDSEVLHHVLHVDKMRDGRKTAEIRFALKEILLDERPDEFDGEIEEATSCVCVTLQQNSMAVDDEDESAPDLGERKEQHPPAEAPMTKKDRADLEKREREAAIRNANTEEARKAQILDAAAILNAIDGEFRPTQLLDQINQLRAAMNIPGLKDMPQGSFHPTFTLLRDEKKIKWLRNGASEKIKYFTLA